MKTAFILIAIVALAGALWMLQGKLTNIDDRQSALVSTTPGGGVDR